MLSILIRWINRLYNTHTRILEYRFQMMNFDTRFSKSIAIKWLKFKAAITNNYAIVTKMLYSAFLSFWERSYDFVTSYFLSPSDICGYFRLEFPNVLLCRPQLDAIPLWILVFWYCSIYHLLLCHIMRPVLLLLHKDFFV